MDRTVPRTGSEEIELYIRTYYSLLRSTTDIQIRTLEEVHGGMSSSLHPGARSPDPDMPAFLYTSLRLPPCIVDVDRVVLGQNSEAFVRWGIGDVDVWQSVSARARRRRSYYDGQGTLACYIASRSDIDDILPILTAFQIEWNKLHRRMRGIQVRGFLEARAHGLEDLAVLSQAMGVDPEDLDRLRQAWGDDFWPTLRAISLKTKHMHVRLLGGSLTDYERATQDWWQVVEEAIPSIRHRPVYFVSSNTHSLVNLFSGFALAYEDDLVRFLDQPENQPMLDEWQDIQARQVPSSRENFLYYVMKKYLETDTGREAGEGRNEAEMAVGIQRFPGIHTFDVEIQVLDLARFRPDLADPRLCCPEVEVLRQSEALVVNIDYPLGMAAHQILSHIGSRVGEILGVYIMGKAATLNGVIGDVMLPSVVHDEHSQNSYLFDNAFAAGDVVDLVYGSVLDKQKAVTVRGTFLQNPRYMDVFYREGYSVIEMEAGPYLSAVYEMYRPKRYPDNEIVNLYGLPFDLGILHYASDTPLSKGRNLGTASMSYFGMDPTYAASLAILRRVFAVELARLAEIRPGERERSRGGNRT
jgi:hypothetical protein